MNTLLRMDKRESLFIESGGIWGRKNYPCNERGVKWLWLFYKFPYFKDISIRYVVDFMHIEKNIAYAIKETLFGASNIVSSREDFWQLNIRRNIWVEKYDDEKYRKPSSPYV
jgi:hypothetical protein